MVKVAVMGAGTMGTVHTDAYVRMQNVELVGVVDLNQETAVSLATKRNTKAFTSLEQVLSEENPDVVDVCIPTHLHKDYVEQIAVAKKHVICEKPLATSLEDARAMIDTCHQAGVNLFVGQVVRFFPDYRQAYELIQSGRIGRIGTVRTMRGGVFPEAWEDWYADAKRSGTLIVDLMIHDFDFLRWCFGEVERVYAKSLFGKDIHPIDHAFVSLRFQNGVIAHAEGTWAYPNGFRTELEITGANGMVVHKSEDSSPIQTFLRSSNQGPVGVAVPESPFIKNPYYLELEHFLSCLEKGETPLVTAEDAYKALEISLAAVKSVQTGEVVTL